MPGSGSEKRQTTERIRLTPRAKRQLQRLAKKHGLAMSGIIEAILTWYIGKCRNCKVVCLHPTERHRWHDPACVLYADRGLKDERE